MSLSVLAAALVLLAVAAGILVAFVRPSTWFSLGLAATMLSGNADQVHLPVSPDRLLCVAGLASLTLGFRGSSRGLRRRLRAADVLVVVAAVAAIASALDVGSLSSQTGVYSLLDRFGLVPFALFLLAPRVFADEEDRRVLICVMTICGAYLGLTAIAEITHASALVFPRYINDPSVGIHFGRARGPFVEAAANGLALFECGVAAAVGTQLFRERWARYAAWAVGAVCTLGVLLTLTRAAWIGAVAGALVGALFHPKARRYIIPASVVVAIGLGVALLAIPGLYDKAATRAAEERPVWDRLNTNAAALRAFEEHPLFGVGWDSFARTDPDRLRQADTYPLTGAGVGVHNVFLSNLAEIGAVGTLAWVLALGFALAAAWRGSRYLPAVWRAGLAAIFVDWAVMANLGPIPYVFPNLCVWIWLGVVSAPAAFWRLDRGEFVGDTESPSKSGAHAVDARPGTSV